MKRKNIKSNKKSGQVLSDASTDNKTINESIQKASIEQLIKRALIGHSSMGMTKYYLSHSTKLTSTP